MDNTPEEKFDKIKYNNEYNKVNYDRLTIVIPSGTKAKLQAYCKDNNISVNGLINKYIDSLPLDM